MNANFDHIMPAQLGLPYSIRPHESERIWQDMKKFYWGGSDHIDINNPVHIKGFIDVPIVYRRYSNCNASDFFRCYQTEYWFMVFIKQRFFMHLTATKISTFTISIIKVLIRMQTSLL